MFDNNFQYHFAKMYFTSFSNYLYVLTLFIAILYLDFINIDIIGVILLKNKFLSLPEVSFMILGCLLMALSLNIFFEPHSIAPGGLTGLAIVINSIVNLHLWVINLVFNIPLFIWAYKILSKKDCLKTIIGIIFLTLFLNITEPLAHLNATTDPLLATLAGSIVMGISLGLIFRVNGSTGGTDLIGLLTNKYIPTLSIPILMGLADFMVVSLSGIVSNEIEIALYSALSLYITVKISDLIIEGFNYSKSFTIISSKSHDISQAIIDDLDRSATLLSGKGAYLKENTDVILVVVSKKEVVTLKHLVKAIDPHAFIIITDIHEALGNGFKKFDS